MSFEALAQSLGRGLPCAAALRAVLEEVGPGFQVKWERMVYRAVLKRGVRMTPQAKVTAPDGREAYLDLGRSLYHKGVLPEVVDAFERAITL